MYRKDKKEEFYTKKSKEEGYPARSVYKLKEIDETFNLFKKGHRILDLGSAPGSWLLYLSEKAGFVLGIDEQEITPKRKNIFFIKKSILDEDILEALGQEKFDSVLADLSPKTTGIKSLDSGLSLELCQRAFFIAQKVLRPKGNFVCKIFESAEADGFFKSVSSSFESARRFRPKAVIKKSKEIYIVAKGYKNV